MANEVVARSKTVAMRITVARLVLVFSCAVGTFANAFGANAAAALWAFVAMVISIGWMVT